MIAVKSEMTAIIMKSEMTATTEVIRSSEVTARNSGEHGTSEDFVSSLMRLFVLISE
jgi:hypothetical protein